MGRGVKPRPFRCYLKGEQRIVLATSPQFAARKAFQVRRCRWTFHPAGELRVHDGAGELVARFRRADQ